MKIVITGGAGFIGRRVAVELLRRNDIDELVLFDAVSPGSALPPDKRLRFVAGDIADAPTISRLIDRATASVFHLAAVVSAEAEADTAKGLKVNLDGTRAVLEACRAAGQRPRLVFASSLAVYGGALPPMVSDDTALTPQTSYGTQKAIGELLVNDFSRKGYIDGRALRLPTIVVRPGRPNRAASTWASSLFREPLSGIDVVCPVSPATVMAILSPRRLIAALLQLHDLPGDSFGPQRSLLLPGISVTVAEMVAALARAGGKAAVARIRWQADPAIQQIVDGWPRAIEARRAGVLGIRPDADIDAVVRAFIEDDLPDQRKLAATL